MRCSCDWRRRRRSCLEFATRCDGVLVMEIMQPPFSILLSPLSLYLHSCSGVSGAGRLQGRVRVRGVSV